MRVKARPTPLADQQHIVLQDVSWRFYEQLLREIDDRPIRVTYNNGTLEMMAPLAGHEGWKKNIGRMIEIIALELNIPMLPLGSTTFKSKELKKGLEPDECYYFSHAAEVQGKERLEVGVDPPPDLAVEVDLTRRSVKREPIYRALGVPELWRLRRGRLTVLLLGEDHRYHVSPTSAAFPFLPMTTFEAFLLRSEHEPQTALMREFRDWVRTLTR